MNKILNKMNSQAKEIVNIIIKDRELKELIYEIISQFAPGAVQATKSLSSIRDRFFTRKLFYFLHEFEKVPREEIENFVRELDANPKYARDVGEHIIVLLDNADQVHKATLLGKTFRAYIEKYIDVEDLQRMSSAINRLLICDLEKLESFSKINEGDPSSSESLVRIFRFLESNEDVVQSFFNAGFGKVSAGWGVQGAILPNKTCKLFVKYVLKNVEK
jgi:hypothetical protein